MVKWLGIFNTVLQVLAGLFCGEFHKGFTAMQRPHYQSYIVSCMPCSAVSCGLPTEHPPTAENFTGILSAVGGLSAVNLQFSTKCGIQ